MPLNKFQIQQKELLQIQKSFSAAALFIMGVLLL